MKENVIKTILLSIFLIAISFVVIIFMGKTYTLSFDPKEIESDLEKLL